MNTRVLRIAAKERIIVERKFPEGYEEKPSEKGWFAVQRGGAWSEIVRQPGGANAFLLLTLIAERAKWKEGFSIHGLELGEAMLGKDDVQLSIGMSPSKYKTAKKNLIKWGLISTRTVGGRYTVARIISNSVYDLWPKRLRTLAARSPADATPSSPTGSPTLGDCKVPNDKGLQSVDAYPSPTESPTGSLRDRQPIANPSPTHRPELKQENSNTGKQEERAATPNAPDTEFLNSLESWEGISARAALEFTDPNEVEAAWNHYAARNFKIPSGQTTLPITTPMQVQSILKNWKRKAKEFAKDKPKSEQGTWALTERLKILKEESVEIHARHNLGASDAKTRAPGAYAKWMTMRQDMKNIRAQISKVS